ncbi:TPA: transglycosylase SLT domain-containing protein [Acinetobacter baumannii]|nr:replication protein [Acinetobacter baumannii]HCT5552255.1 transglycosylase SLT domain-containing protein [Acinetobacter baumannii]HCT6804032.1 transglycosylase SLT domain-containing protein [Acinetobacter baumannii]
MAATNLGSLSIDLVVNIGNFVEPINQAERKAKSASETIGQSFKTIGSTMKSVSDFMNNQIVAGLTSTVTRVIDTGSEIKKLAQLANTSTSSFQYYAKGAETVGISMDKFANQLKGMQQNIGNFQQTGGGPLADFFKNIAPQVGVTISQFQKLSGPDALQLYYDSLVKANVSQESMRFYMEALISDSTALIPLLENGGAGFKKWGDTAQKAGIIMDDAMIKKLSQAKENLQIMDLQWQGLQATMVNGIMPVFIAVTSHMDTITAAAVGLGAALSVKLAVQAAMVTKEFAVGAIEGVRTVATFANVTAASLQTATAMGVLRGAVAFLGGPAGIAMLAFQAVVAGGAYYLMTQKTKDTTEALSDQGLTIDELKEKYKKLNAEQLKIKSLDVADEINKQNKIISDTFSQLDRRVYNLLTGAGTEKQAGALQQYIDDLKAGGGRAAQALNVLSSTDVFNDDQLRSIADFGLKIKGATDEIQRQKDIQSLVEEATDVTTKAQENQAKAVNNTAKEWQALTQRQREALTAMKNDALRDQYIKNTIKNGWTPDQAEAFAKYRDSAGIGFSSKDILTPLERKSVIESFNRKNYITSPLEKQAVAKVLRIASANNFSKIESLHGLPVGALSALILNESSGDPNARSKTGARGLLQTTSKFREEYQLTAKSTLFEVATAAAEDLAKNTAKFGSFKKALIAYNAGPTGTENYLAGNIGHKKGQMSPEKAKEIDGYVPRYQKWFAAVNGKSTVDNSILMPTEADQLEAINKAAEAQKAIDNMQKEVNSNYLTVPQKLAQDHKDRTEKAIIAFGGTDKLKEVLAQEDALYKAQLAKFTSDTKDQYNQYFAFETDRIKQIEQNYDRQKELINSNAEYEYGKSKDALKIKEALDRKKGLEIEAVKREEQQQVQAAIAAYLSETEIVLNRYKLEREEIQKNSQLTEETREKLLQAKDMAIADVLTKNNQKMEDHAIKSLDVVSTKRDPNKAAWDTLQNQYNVANGSIDQDYRDQRAGIFLATDDESERSAQLLAAHQEYLIAKSALDEEYAQREADLTQQQFETKLQVYSQIAGMTGQVFDQMANMVAESAGKSNALYKTMFLASKAASIAQAIVNTEEGATKALAQGGAYGSFLAAFVRATGYASVGIMAAQTIQGFATGGQIRGLGNGLSDSIPIWASNEEFMIKQSSAKKIGLDNLNYMNQTGELPQTESSQIIVPQLAELPSTGSAINAPVSVNVTVNSDGSSQVDSSGQYKLVGEVLGNTIRQVLLQELRQGRILYNAIRG